MAHVTTSRDPLPSLDAPLEQAADAATMLSKPIRCRLQPGLYDWGATSWRAWYGLSWVIECQDAAEGKRLREGLTSFFQAFGGNERQQTRLLKELEKLAMGAAAAGAKGLLRG